MKLSILYRGPLSSCNYACSYCPFAKRRETRAQLDEDRRALERFVAWATEQRELELSVLFTPWGEALVRSWYQRALARLTRLTHIRRAAIQTNLSMKLSWIAECDRDRLALWCTYHPSQVSRERFLERCRDLHRQHVRFSVGVVGLREHLSEIETLRRELPDDVYLWVNAYKREPDYYLSEDLRRLERVDPLFPVNNVRHPSRGRSCRCGSSVVSVDGEGTVRRCLFVREPLGNVYEPGFLRSLRREPCPQETCGCHIGYVHLDALRLGEVFGSGVLERIPDGWATRAPSSRR